MAEGSESSGGGAALRRAGATRMDGMAVESSVRRLMNIFTSAQSLPRNWRDESKTAPLKTRKGAAPVYEGVGSVKRHVDCARRGLVFSFLPIRIFSLSCISTKARCMNLAVESGSTNHLFGHRIPTMIRFSDAAIARGSKAPNQASDELAFTRVPPGLPCLRTSCAYAAPLRSIQYIRTANLRAMATLATACPLRNFNR
jgi:hypothetical protein